MSIYALRITPQKNYKPMLNGLFYSNALRYTPMEARKNRVHLVVHLSNFKAVLVYT